jgi:sugar lactone lactonase YvrE
VIRFAPDGRIDRIIEMPVQRPTSCIFGGPELRHLYITSASTGLREAELARQPLAGHVFVVEPDVTGLPEPLFAG